MRASPSPNRGVPGMTTSEGSWIAAFDIGGTNVRCAVSRLADPGRPVARHAVPTPDDAGPDPLIDLLDELLDACRRVAGLERAELRSVGCALPGIVDADAGVVRAVANVKGWTDAPARRLLEARFGVPAAVENDVNAAALGEYALGAGRGRRSLAYMTVSTGVAAGLVLDGRLWRGHHHAAGEIAFMLTEPRHIGKDWEEIGCLELTSAGVGLGRAWAAERGGAPAPARARELFEAAAGGDRAAQALVDRAADYLAMAAVALCSVADPEILVLGGSIAQHQPRVAARIREVVAGTLPFPPVVAPAALEGDAPIVGALALAAATAGGGAGAPTPR